jgi:WS/DGAT/MGAT family acyltransferase
LRACEQLRRRPFVRGRPLWQLWLLPGLADGQVGMFVKMQHALADGVAGMVMLGNLLDSAPLAAVAETPAWTPRPRPTVPDLWLDNMRHQVTGLIGAVTRLAHPAALIGRCRRASPLRQLLIEQRQPGTSLNRPLGQARRITVVQCRLRTVREAAHHAGATVNDVVLAAVTGGLRELLRTRGENVTGLVLRAMVPVTLHDPGLRPAQGNRYGVMVVPLPVGEPDAAQRLQAIAAQTATLKKQPRPPWGSGLLGLPAMQRLALRAAAHQHFVDIHVANVPGPTSPLHLAGARLVEMFPVVPLSGNLTLGIGVLSYLDQLAISVVADIAGCPDSTTFTAALDQCLTELTNGRVIA